MSAWWYGTRSEFVDITSDEIAEKLNSVATDDGWKVEREQKTEWRESISLLRKQAFEEPIELLRDALRSKDLNRIDGVLLEYDFRRRGLRIDAILLVGVHAIVIEFKRSKLTAGDRDQVVNIALISANFMKKLKKIYVTVQPKLFQY